MKLELKIDGKVAWSKDIDLDVFTDGDLAAVLAEIQEELASEIFDD